ncbi:PREDICTED: DNA-binding protein D-ETS-4 isoform X2 [Ceratosolen solmsi marchali]|uniref:DNA-binding protein D-ETS-4 isoform X2 n=1 Tax=Ceratosolen solmsi marchali TaxID=326594 RepID=A0AAJ7E0U6_9HYME|nr:PREDICTED: DNA-binding protein D-ETS-4 isoform X2 [Ceratosolen solmsi marchali]
MPQTVPTAVGLSSAFEYSTFQFDLSLLSDDYTITNTTMISNHLLQVGCGNLKPTQIKQEACSSRSVSPTYTYSSPPYPCLSGEISPNYARDASPVYPASPYYVPQSPQSAQLYPTSPEPAITITKQPVIREKSWDLFTILNESRILAESLGYKADSTDCTVPCTPPRTEEDIYNALDADFFPIKEQSNPLLKEILFKEDINFSQYSSSTSSLASNCSNSSIASSSATVLDYDKTSLRDLLFYNTKCTIIPNRQNNESSILIKTGKSKDFNTSKDIIEEDPESKGDHLLLREVLRDTSFQRRYNLRPIDFGTVGTGFVEDMAESGECVEDLACEQIEPVLNLAIQQLQKDFDNTCVALGIHPEPHRWSMSDVAAWVQWAKRQLQLPLVSLDRFKVDGLTLATFTEEEFCQRAPECGSMLHAQLEIWKAAVEESPRNTLATSGTSMSVLQCSDNIDEDEISSIETSIRNRENNKIRSNGSHIHLWQFLKELLQCPSIHGSCIRWLDRNKGIFKIEDSVRVARLWGKRKNRPAMNYDKLSRSIRQYYKKGIMKKTERSQRLVYQFCHPYCL